MCKVVLFYLILGFSETSGNKEKYILGNFSLLFGGEVGFFVQNYCMKWEMLMMGEWWCSVAKSCTTLQPMDCSTPGFPVYHQLPGLAQTHVHWVCDTIQPSHILSSPSPSFSLSQHQSLPMSPFFTSGDQSIGASASVLPMSIQDWFHLGLTGLISLQSKRLSSLLQHHSSKPSILWCSAFFTVQILHLYMTTEKTIPWIKWTFVGRVMSLLFKMLCRFVIAFLLRSKHLLISWLQSQLSVISEPGKRESALFSLFPLLFAMKWWDQMPWC